MSLCKWLFQKNASGQNGLSMTMRHVKENLGPDHKKKLGIGFLKVAFLGAIMGAVVSAEPPSPGKSIDPKSFLTSFVQNNTNEKVTKSMGVGTLTTGTIYAVVVGLAGPLMLANRIRRKETSPDCDKNQLKFD